MNEAAHAVLPKIENVSHMEEKDFSVVLLAAGESRRMGQPKLSLPHSSGQSFVERCVELFLDFGCSRLALVVNGKGMQYLHELSAPWPPRVLPLLNDAPEKGRFLSLQIGLRALCPGAYVFLHNVDNPFVSEGILGDLASRAGTADYIRPLCRGRHGHPVLISPRVASDILRESREVVNVRDYLQRYTQAFVESADEGVLVNINSPEDYKRYFPLT